MARTGRPRGKKFETYLPQTACTKAMYRRVQELADELYEGNIAMCIREAVDSYVRRNGSPEHIERYIEETRTASAEYTGAHYTDGLWKSQ